MATACIRWRRHWGNSNLGVENDGWDGVNRLAGRAHGVSELHRNYQLPVWRTHIVFSSQAPHRRGAVCVSKFSNERQRLPAEG